jgi:DNA topoisomerase-1
MAPDEVTVERALELLAAPSGDRELGDDPETGLPVVAKTGRYGPYVQLGELEPGSTTKVPTASLLSSMTLDTITLDDALRLLSLPRVIGADPADGVEITAQNGRYGPFIKKGTDSRSLEREEQMFTISLGEALAIFAEPKRRRGQRAPAEPLKTLGPDPVSGAPVVLREGRFGPYVTDGETNASLRAGDTIETITMDRAAELLADRRAAGPSKGRRAKKTGAKKTGAKKTVAKQSAAKKTVAKKSAAKKAAPRKAAVKKGAVKNGAAKRAAPKMSAANTAAPESASPENTPVDPPEA